MRPVVLGTRNRGGEAMNRAESPGLWPGSSDSSDFFTFHYSPSTKPYASSSISNAANKMPKLFARSRLMYQLLLDFQ